MLRSTIVLLAAALLATGAAAAPKHPPHKPAPKPAAPHAPVLAPTVDARDPAVMVGLLEGGGAKALVAKKDTDSVLVTATWTYASFSIQYISCDPQGQACKAAVFDSEAAGSPSLVQINGFNQSSALCHGYMDKSGKAHVVMSVLLFGNEPRPDLMTHIIAWQGCIGDFSNFARDPVAYLANAP